MIVYKESGIKWLGKIPSHWEVVKGGYLFLHKKDINSDLQCEDRLSLTLNGVIDRDINANDGLNPSDFRTYQIFEKDNLVFKLLDLDNIKTSRVGLVHKKGIMSSAYIRLIAKDCNINMKYFYYQYYNMYLKNIFNALGTGVRATLNYSELLNIEILNPPLEEQKKIADFLDKKLEKIDYFIAKQTKFIELLKEQKQVLINQATIKGLNKSTELKDTHIPHLDKIPTHWEITKIGKVATQITDGSHFTPDYVDDGVPFISVKDISNGFIDFSDTKFISEKEYQDMKFRCNPEQGDLLLSKIGTICSPAIVETNKPFNIFVSVALLKLNNSIINNKYLYYLCYCSFVKKQALLNTEGVGNKNWVLVKIRETIIVLPPLEEQEKIAKYLDDKCEKIDKAINNITKQISLIQEYKTSLIDTTTKGMLKELK